MQPIVYTVDPSILTPINEACEGAMAGRSDTDTNDATFAAIDADGNAVTLVFKFPIVKPNA